MGGNKRRVLMLAYLVVGILLAIAVAGFGWRVYAQLQDSSALTILIARAKLGDRDLGKGLRDQLIGAEAMAGRDVAIRYVARSYTSSDEARADGTKRGASLLVWGQSQGEGVELRCEFLAAPPPIRFDGDEVALPERLTWPADAPAAPEGFVQAITGWVGYASGQPEAAADSWQQATGAASTPPSAAAVLQVYLAALALQQPSDLPDAQARLQQATDLDGGLFEAHLGLAMLHVHWCGSDGSLDLALHEAQVAAELRPGDARAPALLGDVYAVQGKWQDAAAAYDQALSLQGDDLTIWNKLGLAYYAAGDDGPAQSAFSAVLSRAQAENQRDNQASPAFWSELGLAYGYLSLYDQAQEAFHMAESLGGADSQLYRRMGHALNQQGQPDAALEAYLQAVATSPGDAVAQVELGDLYRQQGDVVKAEAAYQAAAAAKPCDAEPYLALGEIYFDRGDYRQASAYFEQGVVLEPGDAEANCALGVSCYLDEQWDRALTAFRAAASLAPDMTEAFLGLGRIYSQRGQDADALVAYERVTVLSPDLVDGWMGLGDAYRELDEPDSAKAAYQQALQLSPEDANLWLTLATLYDSEGDLDNAVEAYQAALAHGEGSLGHAALGSAYQRRGNLSLAAEQYELALQADPGNQEYEVNLGLIYIAEDRLVRAQDLVQDALKTEPGNALAHFLMGLILEKQGKTAEAIAAYRQAAALSKDDESIHTNAKAQLQRLGATEIEAPSPTP